MALSAHFNTKIEHLIPGDCEKKVAGGKRLSHQFNLDLARGLYQIVLPDGQVEEIKHEGELIGFFGFEDAKRISYIANQAHMAIPYKMMQNIVKSADRLPSLENGDQEVRIVKKENNEYVIESLYYFRIKDLSNGEDIPGIDIFLSRKTTLQRFDKSEGFLEDDFTLIARREL